MTRDQLKSVLDRVLTWPPERQEAAVRVLTEMEKQHRGGYRLTDDQVREVKRRIADPDPKSMTIEEARARLAKPGT